MRNSFVAMQVKQSIMLNQSQMSMKNYNMSINKMAEGDFKEEEEGTLPREDFGMQGIQLMKTSVAHINRMVDRSMESMLEAYSRLEYSYKNDIRKKIVEEEENPFSEPINLKNIERHLDGLKKVIHKIKKAMDNTLQKEMKDIQRSSIACQPFMSKESISKSNMGISMVPSHETVDASTSNTLEK
jgi:hypothetical protein